MTLQEKAESIMRKNPGWAHLPALNMACMGMKCSRKEIERMVDEWVPDEDYSRGVRDELVEYAVWLCG
jgi:hypothetical protein